MLKTTDNSYTCDDDAQPQVMIIDPAARVPELDCFNYWSTHSPGPLSYHIPALIDFSSLPQQDKFANILGVIVLGSGSSIYDDEPWLAPLIKWLSAYFATNKPFLGLCFGHQLLAHMYGGKIGFLHNDQQKEQGIREVKLLASPINQEMTAPMLVSHREIVTELPKNFVAWGSSDLVQHEGIRHESLPLYGLQPHPEATKGFFRNQSVSVDYSHSQLAKARLIVSAFINRCFVS